MKNAEQKQKMIDPTINVKEMFEMSIRRIDDLHQSEIKRIDDKFKDFDTKYQIQFIASKEAVSIASTAQKELVAQALGGTKEAITKNDTTTEKRFELLSDQIRALSEILNKNSGAQGIYVTHVDLSNEMSKLRADFEIMLRPVVNFMQANQGGKEEVKNVWGYAIGAFGAGIALVTLIMRFVQ